MALPLLPATHTVPAFRQLQRLDATPAITDLLQYVDTTWLASSVWSSSTLSVYQQEIRTNNDLEGWHRHINSIARHSHIPFHMMVELLLQEVQTMTLQLHLLSDVKVLCRASTYYTAVNMRLTELWMGAARHRKGLSSQRTARVRVRVKVRVRPLLWRTGTLWMQYAAGSLSTSRLACCRPLAAAHARKNNVLIP